MPVGAMLGASAVSAGVGIYGASKAAGSAQHAADENNALQKYIYDQNSKNLGGFMDRGNEAGGNINSLLGLGGDAAGAEKAYNQYLDSTGYKFQLQQGADAIDSNAASSHLLHSGANLKNLSNYGQQMGKNYFQQYLGNLQTQQGVGLSGANALAGVGTDYANAVSQNNNSAATANGNAWLYGANQVGGLFNSAASMFGQKAGAGGAGGAAGSGVWQPMEFGG